MANSHLGLTLFSLVIFFSLTKPTLSQDPSPTVFEILPKFGLPSGLLPKTVKSYSLSDDGSFTVYLEKECYVEFDYLVYYEKKITGKLSYGSISDLKGIQVQRFFLWLGVDNIRVDLPPSDSIYFQVGWINKKLDVDQFKTVHSCRAGVSSGSCGGLWKQFLEGLFESEGFIFCSRLRTMMFKCCSPNRYTTKCFCCMGMQLRELDIQYGLPRGLLPDNVESYTLSPSDGTFEVKLKSSCYVHFDEVVYYGEEIKGKLSYGSVHDDVSGIQAKKLFVWLSVTGIEVSKVDSGMIKFFVGSISEELPAKQFEVVPACKRKVGGLRAELESMWKNELAFKIGELLAKVWGILIAQVTRKLT
ncbi:hypothetical protein NC651_009675 [Populus alba x Populus x berolinensis]|nr:hypothetical protein NC651_009675 [Populus alba x Populus x berolinensis]